MRRKSLAIAGAICILGTIALAGAFVAPAAGETGQYELKAECTAGFEGATADAEARNPGGGAQDGARAHAKAFVRWVLENEPEQAEDGPYYALVGASASVDLTRELFEVPTWIARVASSYAYAWNGYDNNAVERPCEHNCYTVHDCIPLFNNLPGWAQQQLHATGCQWAEGAASYDYSGTLHFDEETETLGLEQVSTMVNLTATPKLDADADVTDVSPPDSTTRLDVRIHAFGNDSIGCRFIVDDA